MKPLGIRHRILLIALVPAALVAFLVTGLLVAGQVEQARIEQHRRLAAVARQIAAAAEYNIFVGNTAGLLALLETTSSEPDIVGAAILDPVDKVLASTVPIIDLPRPEATLSGMSPPAHFGADPHWHTIPIRASNYEEQDLFAGTASPPAPVLGRLLLGVSAKPLRHEILRGVLTAAGLSLLVVLLGALLALVLSRNLIRLLLRISQVVDQVGHGIGTARVGYAGPDELGQLAAGIDRMIERVEISQAELARRIAEATQALRREKEDAEEAALSRSRFFAAASHDLRQPVQALGLFVAQLEREASGSPLQARVGLLAQSVRNLQALLDTLLDYSRLDGKVLRTELRPVNARIAIDSVVTEFAAAAAAKGLALRSRADDCWLLTDPVLLHRILLNLVGNAIRHTRLGGVLVGCRHGTTQARIGVWDTGPGIPPDQQDAIFDELVQLDNPERDAGKGLGLGLAIVRRIADLLRHPLTLRSRLGRGSCFSVTIPLTNAPHAPPPGPVASAPGQMRILVLCPAGPQREELAALLDGWERPISSAGNAEEAIADIAARGAPALVICETGGRPEEVRAILDRIDAAAGRTLPALLIHPGPLAEPAAGNGRRLLLARPFRPARLRALLDHLLEPEPLSD